ncbi:hypothetical protein [Streptomyces sp. NPDC048057]|uniref:hypothetical protein n=1 Tax=Streptomyces sp. NPDC048057 TaxID=3155628 RepID=UPI0033CECD8D
MSTEHDRTDRDRTDRDRTDRDRTDRDRTDRDRTDRDGTDRDRTDRDRTDRDGTEGGGSAPPTRGAAALAWVVPVLFNLVLGLLAVVPLWLSIYLAVNYPLAELGLTEREPTENDGVLPGLTLLVPLMGGLLGLWYLIGKLMRRGPLRAARAYWWVGGAMALLPTTTLFVLVGLL